MWGTWVRTPGLCSQIVQCAQTLFALALVLLLMPHFYCNKEGIDSGSCSPGLDTSQLCSAWRQKCHWEMSTVGAGQVPWYLLISPSWHDVTKGLFHVGQPSTYTWVRPQIAQYPQPSISLALVLLTIPLFNAMRSYCLRKDWAPLNIFSRCTLSADRDTIELNSAQRQRCKWEMSVV